MVLTYSNQDKTITLTLEKEFKGIPIMEQECYCLILRGNGCAFVVLARDSDFNYLQIKVVNIANILGLKYCPCHYDGDMELPRQNVYDDYLEYHLNRR